MFNIIVKLFLVFITLCLSIQIGPSLALNTKSLIFTNLTQLNKLSNNQLYGDLDIDCKTDECCLKLKTDKDLENCLTEIASKYMDVFDKYKDSVKFQCCFMGQFASCVKAAATKKCTDPADFKKEIDKEITDANNNDKQCKDNKIDINYDGKCSASVTIVASFTFIIILSFMSIFSTN
ncbi:uncharacterized protein LOC128958475 [Oppia nitens]|uniref:uncharacterized protein LOC128958475 n=1 Tax=Oppia nitens TaxID=1686743 RepID=UPI0023DAFB91|nr:uncharacterized protein LOC128958475 [Oppia nitens]